MIHPDLTLLRKLLKTSFLIGTAVMLSSCQTAVKSPAADLSSGQSPEEIRHSKLSADLLYDILVASIASRRNAPDVALEHLARAALASGDGRLIAESIQLAMANNAYQQAIDLARLLIEMEPGNHQIILSVAEARLALGEIDSALGLLTDLAENTDERESYVFQDIAALIFSQDRPEIIHRFRQLVREQPNAVGLQITAAFLASNTDESDLYLQQLEKVLDLRPDWEFPAVLKLTQLAITDAPAAHEFALDHLDRFPRQSGFRLQYARFHVQNDALDSALDHLNFILDESPESLDALYTAGVIHLEKNNLPRSKELLTRYLELDPQNEQVRIYLSDIEAEHGNYIEASNYLHGVASRRYYLEAQIRLSMILAKRYEVESGLKYLQQIDAVTEENKVRLIIEQDLLLREYDQIERSKVILDEGLEKFPDHPDLLYNRGLLAAEMELISLHEKDMRRLIELEPKNAHAYNALGYTLADKTDRLEEAMQLIEKANALLPDNPFILDSMGWIHFRLGNHAEAIKYLRLALDARQDAEIAAHLGEVLWTTGNKEEAREIWKKGTEWGPDNKILQRTIERFSPQRINETQIEDVSLKPFGPAKNPSGIA